MLGCPDFRLTSRLSRRRLIQAGFAGVAGLGLPALLRAAESGGGLQGAGQARDLPAPVRRPVAPGYVRHEARRALGHPGRVQADRDGPAGPVGHRAPAAVRHGGRPVRAGPVGAPSDEEPQLGDLLQPDRPRPAARRHPAPRHPGALPGLRQHGRPAPARRTTRRSRRSSRYPHVLRDGSVTPGQHASFLGKAYDPFFIGQDPNQSDFRLPELSLPVVAVARPARGPPRAPAT